MAKWSRSLIRVRYAMEEIAIEDDEYVISVHIMSETWYAKKNGGRCVQYELRLVASDNLNENHTTVVINVKDVNDNPPVFDRPIYEAQITEEDDRSLPKRILQVVVIKKHFFSLPFSVVCLCCSFQLGSPPFLFSLFLNPRTLTFFRKSFSIQNGIYF